MHAGVDVDTKGRARTVPCPALALEAVTGARAYFAAPHHAAGTRHQGEHSDHPSPPENPLLRRALHFRVETTIPGTPAPFARPQLTAWRAPVRDLGMTAVSYRSVGSTDHVAFDEVGLPGFQFLQDHDHGRLCLTRLLRRPADAAEDPAVGMGGRSTTALTPTPPAGWASAFRSRRGAHGQQDPGVVPGLGHRIADV